MLEIAKLFNNVSALLILVSSLDSYLFVIVIDPNLHKDLWDFIRTKCEIEKKSCLVTAWPGRPKGGK